ncbi:ferredoxin--NADP(+) reductase [Cryobacterium sp. TMS1-20-1]|uniref:FAD-dependent oxidoreductase n=1 Tax=Cryobacterium sp. TMS1-20-1 TaxID=1259223 RepID=UPI00106B1A3C|nr:FAD-dependent oxidoreductase [Cryobacterium sp. TMS1-20-1]TFC70952.1 ferredoxin--NADP(+) reductase [Cryobacterium sp. TMS1-20-1]
MTYVIAKGCCNDASCISVCPVDCIRPRPGDPEFMTAEQLYIDPSTCIDCSACVTACPVSAIYDENDMPEEFDLFKQINADYFEKSPLDISHPARKKRRSLTEQQPVLRVAIVGAGASGCYAADELARIAGVEVSVFDRRPVPFGLVRGGVAPDHHKTKAVADQFEKTLRRPNVTSYFNVDVGIQVTLDELLEFHHAVVFAVGATSDKTLGIPGEALEGSYSARQFVAWYNGDSSAADLPVDLSGQRVVVVGNGNVSMDVARILAAPVETFEPTDMADHALQALRHSAVREVVVVARRGPVDAAHTFSELWQLTQLEGVDVVTDIAEIDHDVGRGDGDGQFGSERKLAMNTAFAQNPGDDSRRKISLRYYLTPEAIGGDGSVESMTFRSSVTGELETFQTGLILRAIGYRAEPIRGVPFDPVRGTIRNIAGRVTTEGAESPIHGLYCTGWAKRGPTGVIGTNKVDSQQTVAALCEDFESGNLTDPARLNDDVATFMNEKQPDLVSFAGWQRIDAAERERGRISTVPRTRSKLISVDALLAASRL